MLRSGMIPVIVAWFVASLFLGGSCSVTVTSGHCHTHSDGTVHCPCDSSGARQAQGGLILTVGAVGGSELRALELTLRRIDLVSDDGRTLPLLGPGAPVRIDLAGLSPMTNGAARSEWLVDLPGAHPERYDLVRIEWDDPELVFREGVPDAALAAHLAARVVRDAARQATEIRLDEPKWIERGVIVRIGLEFDLDRSVVRTAGARRLAAVVPFVRAETSVQECAQAAPLEVVLAGAVRSLDAELLELDLLGGGMVRVSRRDRDGQEPIGQDDFGDPLPMEALVPGDLIRIAAHDDGLGSLAVVGFRDLGPDERAGAALQPADR